jgi:1,4-dihydroxy-2-naphthoate octaprenyltransferase
MYSASGQNSHGWFTLQITGISRLFPHFDDIFSCIVMYFCCAISILVRYYGVLVNTTVSTRSSFSLWLQAVRAFSFTASMVPIIVGAMLALAFDGAVRWDLFPVVVLCSLLIHAGTNLFSDYYDYKKGVDKEGAFGGSGVLVGRLLAPKQLFIGGLISFGLCFLLGLVFVQIRGIEMLYLGIIGLVGGFLYCGGIGYKYLALGDVLVFWLMGPLMVLGSYFVLTGTYNSSILLTSMPVGFLVTAILHANNLRDIQHDKAAHVRTMATILGLGGAKIEYYLLIAAAYLSVVIMVAVNMLSPWTLVVLLSLPPALKNVKVISQATPGTQAELAMIDVQTAQHHFLFGILLSVGLLLSALL